MDVVSEIMMATGHLKMACVSLGSADGMINQDLWVFLFRLLFSFVLVVVWSWWFLTVNKVEI
jgi:hypothetical protein